jgi:hypothetical protein
MVIGFHTKNRTTYFSAPRKDWKVSISHLFHLQGVSFLF